MRRNWITLNGRGIGKVVCLVVGSLLLQPAPASADFAEGFRAELYAGDTAAAAGLAEAEIASDPADGTAQAALGVARFLGTIENLIQGLHRHGLNNGSNGFGALAMSGMPFLRLPVPDNPTPEPVTYQALRGILGTFSADLATVAATLAKTDARPVTLELDLARIRLDLDGDGASDREETLMTVFMAVAGPVRPGDDAGGLVVDFDASDAIWLRAYSHLLMGMTDVILAHDWEAAYRATFQGLFPRSFRPVDGLNAIYRDAPARLQQLRAQMPEPPTCNRWEDGKPDEACVAEHEAFKAHPLVIEREGLGMALEYGSIADLVAFVHLLRWPVVDADRLAGALGHFEQMVALSRQNMQSVLAETDNGREWIPNPRQTGVFRSLPLDQARIDGWLGFLDQIEAVLQGRALLPHWRFKQGFNLRRMFLEPGTLDAVMMVHGAGVLPYLEDGPIAHSGTWSQATRVFGGDFFTYFIWIN